MTAKELEAIKAVQSLLSEIRQANEEYRKSIDSKVENLTQLVQEKHLPLSFEQQILSTIQGNIAEAFKQAMVNGYNNPVKLYVENVIKKHQDTIEKLFEDTLTEVIEVQEFKDVMRQVLLKKVTQNLLAGVDGSVDKVVSQIKQDAVFRSKLTLVVNNLVEEFLNQK